MRISAAIIILFICTISSSGCGYTLRGSGSILPPDVRRIYVAPVVNNSTESNLGQLMTEALQDSFEQYGAVAVVDNEATADAVLRARVQRVSRGTASSTSRTDQALQQDLTMVVDGELRRTTGGLLWKNPRLSVSKPIGVSANVVVTSSSDFAGSALSGSDLSQLGTRELSRGQEQEAFEQLVIDVANKVYDEAVAPDF